MLSLLHDLRYAARYLRKSLGFTAVAVLTLALGTGANTAVFSLINTVLLKPLPYPEPGRLVLVWESAPFFGLHDSPVSPANYLDWKARSRSFAEMGGLEERSYRLFGTGAPEIVKGALVTASCWRALGTRPAMGRIFRDDEDQPGAAKVAIVSNGFWRRWLAADPHAVGRPIRLGDDPYTIVGVLAPGSEPPAEYSGVVGEIFTAFGSTYSADGFAARGRHNWMVIARLHPGVAPGAANAEMQAIGAALAREYPDTNEKVGAFVAPLREHFVGSSHRVLLILLGTVFAVLLISCANLANLLLARTSQRGKELAVRAALGAGRWQMVRQSFCESLLLCVAGNAAGALLAAGTFDFLAHLAPGAITGMKSIGLDWRVLAFTAALTGLTALVFGLVPVFQARKLDVSAGLKQSARTLAAASGSRRLRAVLIATEVALAFVLLIGAGLMIQSFARLRGVDPGCRTKNLLTLQMPGSAKRSTQAQITAYLREVRRRIETIPGVESAGFTNHIPIVFKGDVSGVGAEGHGPKERFQCNSRVAGPGYMRTMGIPILRGRDIADTDVDGAPLVALVNETLARAAWPNQDPIGRRLLFGASYQVPVVGVVGDVRNGGLDTPPKPEFYVSAMQAGFAPGALAIHTRVAPDSLAGAVRRAIWSIDPEQAVTDVVSMQDILDKEVFQRRLQMTLLAVFAGLALALACIGLYGLLAYQVGQQVPEIGLRMALGAAPGEVLRRIVWLGVRLTAIGLAVGAAGALVTSRLLTNLLFGVKPTDPWTYGLVATLLLLTAVAASCLPARRAMKIDPITALRQE
jgi:putative ABC transport system permease protein